MTKTSKKIPTKTVIITTQTFREAGGLESFPELEMGNSFSASGFGDSDGGEISAINDANREIRQLARGRGYTHVFDVKYNHDEFHGYPTCKAIGTGYGPRGQ
jgi:hypothetical protein